MSGLLILLLVSSGLSESYNKIEVTKMLECDTTWNYQYDLDAEFYVKSTDSTICSITCKETTITTVKYAPSFCITSIKALDSLNTVITINNATDSSIVINDKTIYK